MEQTFKVVVLISGRGSNLRSLIQNADRYQVIAVITNRWDAGGLSIAVDAGITAVSFGRSDASSLKDKKKRFTTEYGSFRLIWSF